MKTLVRWLSSAVGRRPWTVFIAVVVVTVGLGAFVPQIVQDQGNTGFAPDAEELVANDTISHLFGDGASSSVLQIIVSADGGDVFTADGLKVVQDVESAIAASDLAPLLVSDPAQPPIVTFMLPVESAITQGGAAAPASDADLKQLYLGSLGELPPDVAGVASQLVSADKDLAAPSASRGLILVFVNAPSFDDTTDTPAFDPANEFQDFSDLEKQVTDGLAQLDLPAGYTIQPFSFELLFGTGDEFQAEIGRLFGMAAGIIVLILLFVYWVQGRRGTRFAGVRRTFADMLLTMAAILMAITWMQGIGVIMGPKYLGWIGDFGPMSQIVPILLIGLGVDYAIHVTIRYREEVGHGTPVVDSMRTSIHTVGVALVLATVTTAVGFLTNLVSPIPALKDFGILAAVGIASSFLIVMTFVAAFRVLLDRRAEASGRLPVGDLGATKDRVLPKIIGRASVLAERFAWPTVIAAAILGAAGFVGVLHLEAKFSVTDFVPRPNPLLGTYDLLTTEFSGGFGETTKVLVEGDVATPAAHNAMVAMLHDLADVPDVFAVAGMADADSPLSLIAGLTDPQNPAYSQSVADAAAAAGLSADGTVTAGADVAALYDAVAAAAPGVTHGVLHQGTDGGYDAMLISVTTQAGEARAHALAAEFKQAVQPFDAAGLHAVATSDLIINDVVISAMSNSQLSSLVLAVVAAALLLVINFWVEARRPFLGLITILPVALVMLWAFGLFPVLGLAFGPVTATVSALAIGIGVPYMIHITHRFQEDRVRFETAEAAIRSTTTNTGGALAGSAFTTVAGFGILMTASLVPFQQLGLVTGYTILLALVGAILVLPSMLVLWDRWHRRRGEQPVDAEALRRAFE